ncbi:hypothetical protein [Rossellomorea sp. NRS-1567]|uniref:hypothetical protein n=1 Tax=Rossellomorea sp. NRS-1567 TaxID=3233901 RepID=UPI003D26B818
MTNKDLYLLVKMLGGKVLIGISNPFQDYGDDELEKEWEMMFKKLHKFELVHYIEGELKFEDLFIRAMWVISKSNLVAEIVTDQLEQSIFYFSDDQVVECMKETETSYKIYTHPAPEWTLNEVIFPRMLIGVENRSRRLKDPLYILPSDYLLYCKKQAISNLDELSLNNGVDQDSLIIKQFNRSIQRKIHNTRLMLFYKGEHDWNIEGIHVLSSPSYNWTLKMVSEDGIEWLNARQTTGGLLVQEIAGVFERVKGKLGVN